MALDNNIATSMISGAAQIGSGLVGLYNGYKARKSAEKMNAENLAFQREQLEYNKQLQQTIFNREDNAIQRASSDLQAAGLSKTLAAGQGAGTGSIVSMNAPQNDIASTITPQLEMAKMQQSIMTEAINLAMNVKQIEANIKAQEREQDRADILADNTINFDAWKMNIGEKEFNQKIDEFKNLKNYQQFQKMMNNKYYEIFNERNKTEQKIKMQEFEDMKKWIEYSDDKIKKELPRDMKMWIFQYNRTHSWQQFGWNMGNKAGNTLFDVLGSFFGGKMMNPVIDKNPIGF